MSGTSGRHKLAVRRSSLGLLAASVCLLASAVSAQAATTVFSFTGAEETFTVPAEITSLHVLAVGAKGGTGPFGGVGGFGATVSADLAVTPGEILYLDVGGNGANSGKNANGGEIAKLHGAGGYNGGGDGGDAVANAGAGGGGASDIATAPRTNPYSAGLGNNLPSRLIVAGGGGGGGGDPMAGAGGAGGTGGARATSVFYQGGGGGAGSAGTGGTAGAAAVFGSSVAGPGAFGQGGVGGSDVAAPDPEPNPNEEHYGTRCGGGGGGGGGGLFGGGGGGLGGSGPLCAPPIGSGGGGGGGSSGFGVGVTNASVGTDTTGTPSISLTYAPSSAGPPTGAAPAAVAPSTCLVPNLKGKKLKVVRKALARANCTLGKVKGQKGRTAKVKKQSSKPGALLAPGSKVNVMLGG